MKTHSIAFSAALFLCIPCGAEPSHSIVYRENGRFGGWPANHGIWSWGNEIVVGFRSAEFKVMPVGHARDPEKPQEEYQARSLDGGKTWTLEKPRGIVRPENGGPKPVENPGGIDFTHPDFALMFRASGDTPMSRYYISTDRCRTWKGPYHFPLLGQPRIMARTDYIVESKHELSVFLTAAKRNGKEGRVFLARTKDGGKTWKFVSWIGPEPNGFSIMPSSVRLSPDRILTTLRRKEGDSHWIDAWVTADNGASWRFLNRPVPSTGASVGNPPSLLKLKDGRLALIYGYRSAPYGIRARLSGDEGLTWSEERVLRSDGGCWDLGYPRSVQRPDGRIVSVYYYNDSPNTERYISATVWDPGPANEPQVTSAGAAPAQAATPVAPRPPATKNVVVFKEVGRFGGWPANNGIWSWGNEILVGFSLGYFKNNQRGHAIDGSKPSLLRFARSLDGGETWKIEVPHFLSPDGREPEPAGSPGGFDFSHPDSAVALRMVSSSRGYSRFYYSNDRGHRWQGPFKLPTYDRTGIAARTDYIVNGKHDLTAFITAHKVNGREGRVFAVRTTDGGQTWKFVSWIGPEPNGFSIMPSSLRLSSTRILTTLRRKEGERHWIDAWVTDDDAKTWRFLNRPAESTGGSVGNPPSLIKLKDGRLSLVYGYRAAPYGIRARLSGDEGLTWSEEKVLRGDAGCWDLGYVRSVQRPDGKVVAIYYFNDAPDQERYIAATIWDPAGES